MNEFLNNLERRYGKKAVPRLTAIMIGLIVVGYLLEALAPALIGYLRLDPSKILSGQIWRLVTWVIIPPEAFGIFTIIMLFFYFSIGSSLERAWGDFRYNVYIFGGLLISVIAAFLTYFVFCALYPGQSAMIGQAVGVFFSTYYICMSILLAYAATFPDAVVLLMFVLPVKMKYFGIIYGAFMAYDAINYLRLVASGGVLYVIPVIAMLASVVNFGLFFYLAKNRVHMTAQQKKRQKEFRRQILEADSRNQTNTHVNEKGEKVVDIGARHRCEVCGRTDVSNPELEFRYCSKCAGAHEYCMEHLYTHVHIAAPGSQEPFEPR